MDIEYLQGTVVWVIMSQEVIDVQKASTHEKPANMMAKVVQANKLRHCLDLVVLCSTDYKTCRWYFVQGEKVV